jgi:hypothetical protein
VGNDRELEFLMSYIGNSHFATLAIACLLCVAAIITAMPDDSGAQPHWIRTYFVAPALGLAGIVWLARAFVIYLRNCKKIRDSESSEA